MKLAELINTHFSWIKLQRTINSFRVQDCKIWHIVVHLTVVASSTTRDDPLYNNWLAKRHVDIVTSPISSTPKPLDYIFHRIPGDIIVKSNDITWCQKHSVIGYYSVSVTSWIKEKITKRSCYARNNYNYAHSLSVQHTAVTTNWCIEELYNNCSKHSLASHSCYKLVTSLSLQ